MLTFYIDEPLPEAESAEALAALIAQGRRIDRMEYRRIPCVFPIEGQAVSNERMLDVLKGHVKNAGVPIGRQSILIVPKNGIRWGVLLQEAFYSVTGFYPVVIQPWQVSLDDGPRTITRRDYLHMFDMHAVLTGTTEE
ncbi:hypothetical protein [Massilia yuzhufengensis]|uniref:hypothetical protein n=1 Tax=Massilia yuzhufengensis TaxID=1164594 RepID=UPI001160A76D|nr:hypothetical protein [Massilia yuzhufengensis]